MKLEFSTPSAFLQQQAFGAASFGMAGAENERAKTTVGCPWDLEGLALCGRYEEILGAVPEGHRFQAAIVLLGNAGEEETFLAALSEKVNCPLVGGAAAIDPETGKSGLVTGYGQAAVFLMEDERYTVEALCRNIHTRSCGIHRLTLADPRTLERIDGVDAISFLAAEKEKLGLQPTDFEHLTFADDLGINAHFFMRDGKLCAGRNLEERMELRFVDPQEVDKQMQAFYDDDAAIIFGCAGLRSILNGSIRSSGIGLFLFGEVCTKDGISRFGNLMLSKLRILPR